MTLRENALILQSMKKFQPAAWQPQDSQKKKFAGGKKKKLTACSASAPKKPIRNI